MTTHATDTKLIPAKSLTTTPKLSLGQQAAQLDPAELEEIVQQRRNVLAALMTDETLSESTRLAVQTLAALASPNKPGMEEVSTAWKVPRIHIVQPTTQSEAKPEQAKNGDLYTTAGQLLDKSWTGIPIYFYEENVNFPKESKNPICQAPDAKLGSPFGECSKCPHLPYGKQNGGRGEQQRTDCQNNIVAVMLTADLTHPQVYTMQLGKTSRKAGSALMSLAGQQTAVWRQSYVFTTEKKTGEIGVYYLYKVEPTGKDNSADVMKVAEALYGMFVAGRKRDLADWYARPQRAQQVAVAAEGEFAAGALDVGLANAGVEADLTTPVPTAGAAKGSSARSSNKPM